MAEKLRVKCDWCGKEIEKHPSKVTRHNFCSRPCLAEYSSRSKNPDGYVRLKNYANISAHMSALNRELNPIRDYGTQDYRRAPRSWASQTSHKVSRSPLGLSTREKLRLAQVDRGEGKTYRKLYGRHEHRVVAEQMLGRSLRPGEVVHHIDGNKRNNAPENLMVFASQAEHVRWHKKAGDLR